MDAITKLRDPVIQRIAEATIEIRKQADQWQLIATNLMEKHRVLRDGQCAANCPRCMGEKAFVKHQDELRLAVALAMEPNDE